MDDFIQILIYLIIIFSIFSPLFKKKEQKPPQQPPGRASKERISGSQHTARTGEEEYDILQEIEGLFKTNTSAPTKAEERQTIIGKAEEKRTPIERVSGTRKKPDEWIQAEATRAEENYRDWNKKVNIDDAVARKAAQFAELMKKRRATDSNEGIVKFRKKLNNPETLKDYIIFAEVLGKPKALRR